MNILDESTGTRVALGTGEEVSQVVLSADEEGSGGAYINPRMQWMKQE